MKKLILVTGIMAALGTACGDDSTGRHIDADGGVPPNTFEHISLRYFTMS